MKIFWDIALPDQFHHIFRITGNSQFIQVNIDAKINAFNNAFEKENVVEGGWSQYDRILERQFYNHGLMPEE